jgi:hypothetical protein
MFYPENYVAGSSSSLVQGFVHCWLVSRNKITVHQKRHNTLCAWAVRLEITKEEN